MRRQTNVNEIFLPHEKFSWPGGDHNRPTTSLVEGFALTFA